MRVLFLTQVLPYPLDAGPKVRAYYTLRHLAQRHAVSLVSFARQSDPPEAVAHLQTLCESVETVQIKRGRARDTWSLARSMARGSPFLIERDRSAEMSRSIRARFSSAQGTDPVTPGGATGFDVIHADQLWMAPYGLLAARSACVQQRPAVVLDQHNAVFLVADRLATHEKNRFKRALLSWETRKMRRFEDQTCRTFDHVVWVTDEDRQALAAASTPGADPTAGRSSVIPICVSPPESNSDLSRRAGQRVTFLGGLHWPPNAEGARWFARVMWPRIREHAPEAVLTIIGKDPPGALSRDASSASGIEVTGFVPDPTHYLSETAAFVVPLQSGGGMRVKILDAWSHGLPVISTTVGAEGLAVRDGENLLLADTPEAFVRSVVRVLRDPALAARLAEGGRRTVEAHYNWRRVYAAWDDAYAQALAMRTSRTARRADEVDPT